MIIFLRAAAALLIFIATLTQPAFASFPPEKLGNWRLSSEHVTELTTSESRDMGKWTSASYVRSEPSGFIEVQFMEGSGPTKLFVPEGIISSDDGPIGFLSTYETLSVAGRRAVLERDSLTGQSLAAALDTQTV
ncbi:MAG: hypothetical protein FWG71_01345, partial [Synergistaceae bacterium]|nr:hypothetical protein [Synergistaceae bacterium]